ncbi:hypothetical protein DsansV1_C37g0232661 [Dioscorea sansibarensis]
MNVEVAVIIGFLRGSIEALVGRRCNHSDYIIVVNFVHESAQLYRGIW